MPSLNDFFDEVKKINTNLEQVHSDLQTIHADDEQLHSDLTGVQNSLGSIQSTLTEGFDRLIALQTYADQALNHLAKQNDTIICILEKVSGNTCTLVDQGDLEVRYQRSIRDDTHALTNMFQTAHPDAALVLERAQAVQREIEKCCPPPQPEPPCTYQPCDKPEPLPDPPTETPVG